MVENPTRLQASQAQPAGSTRTSEVQERPWHVIVMNDPVNLMSYVVMVFRRVFGFDQATATRHMLEVHENGRSLVWTGSREKAEAYVQTLHQWQLNAVLEQDDSD